MQGQYLRVVKLSSHARALLLEVGDLHHARLELLLQVLDLRVDLAANERSSGHFNVTLMSFLGH